MRQVETSPSPTVQQVSDVLPSGEPMLAVLAKRTYDVRAGRCVPADEQPPLVGVPVDDPDDPAILAADTDLHPYKPRTDVVVLGHARAKSRMRRFDVAVRVGAHEHRIAVLGERTCTIGPGGKILFSEPKPVDQVPLTYARAYGGWDRLAEDRHGNPLKDPDAFGRAFDGVDLDAASPFRYPRNPAGRGYLVELEPGTRAELPLPQLEDPRDLLTPERLLCDWIDNWHRMPLPWATGWINYNWYPRIAFAGLVPIVEFFDEPPIEVERRLVPDYLADGTGTTDFSSRFELACGAHPGLQLPHLRGGEPVELEGMHPAQHRWTFTVPPAPALHVDGRDGKLLPCEPVLHTLLLEPDQSRVTLVWRGCARARRPYAPHELEAMPLRVAWRD